MGSSRAKRDVLSIADVAGELPGLISRAIELKHARGRPGASPSRANTNLAMIFEKPSTRTRVSFEVAMNDLGGHALYLSSRDLQLGRGETIADSARVLSRYVDAIAYRAFHHSDEVELAKHASVPVINALDDLEHPCQIIADLTTLRERWADGFAGRRLAFIGDGNNVLNSLAIGCCIVGLNLTAAIPEGYDPPKEILETARRWGKRTNASVEVVREPSAAAREADALYTDVWVSMGDEEEKAERESAFQDFRIDAELLRVAKPKALVLHDLPAHRGAEITDDVLDGPQSVVWDQAENRLHGQKALLELLLPNEPKAPRNRNP